MVEKTQDNTTFVINETSKPNSLEIGKAGNRFKVYYDTPNDLEAHLKKLKELELYKDDE